MSNIGNFMPISVVGLDENTDWQASENRLLLLVYKVGLTLDVVRQSRLLNDELPASFVDAFISDQTGLDKQELADLYEQAEYDLDDHPEISDFLTTFVNNMEKLVERFASSMGIDPETLLADMENMEQQRNNEIDDLNNLFESSPNE